MIIAYEDKGELKAHAISKNNIEKAKSAIWIDLLNPSNEEEDLLEEALCLDIPTREEMLEIELSSRLFKNKESLIMTANMIAQADSSNPKKDAVTFILKSNQLITIRYIEPSAFKLFLSQLYKLNLDHSNPITLLTELLEASIDRFADILETLGGRLDELSRFIFSTSPDNNQEKLNYQLLIQKIGRNADLNTEVRECLMTFGRLIAFFSQAISPQINSDEQTRIATLSKDIHSLSDHSNFFSSKVNFLLDATLGMINNEQNAIIKIFSVAAVIFLPPTLIASIYGMNFKHMPELSWKWGYILAIVSMILSALVPYRYFKYKKWL